jgi:NAD-dependent dihydropyrimidine dehydrogenase PreA subunit
MAITIDQDLCEGAGTCAVVCPEDVLEFKDGRPIILNNMACTNCYICVENCASGAIEVD